MFRSWRVACAVSALTAALFAAGTPAPASAQDAGAFKPKAAGDINIRLRGIGVIPTERGDIKTAGGTDTTLDTRLGNAYVPEVDVSYFLTENLALELIAATTKHDVDASNGLDLGSVWLLPPTLTLQYHFLPKERFSPYVGAGVNYTLFYNEKKGALRSISYEDGFGIALQAGIDYAISGPWSLNVDVKKLWLNTDVKANLGGTALKADVDINPWIFGVGLGYRF
ncbi:membrane protein [Skermanella stibiiresistens SB22]|uniref:Membrane protein n=1 Tax=Skermanella stibiiresistens SB22 TaxID=1385369 RepID=W9H9L5_9PROT|nr:OmpW family outer membrane protein [Skermanella stibiiresistens]EWY41397.1 membrane protein [Skermanella stibiiresistens SB22]